jgi:hypothetical protein
VLNLPASGVRAAPDLGANELLEHHVRLCKAAEAEVLARGAVLIEPGAATGENGRALIEGLRRHALDQGYDIEDWPLTRATRQAARARDVELCVTVGGKVDRARSGQFPLTMITAFLPELDMQHPLRAPAQPLTTLTADATLLIARRGGLTLEGKGVKATIVSRAPLQLGPVPGTARRRWRWASGGRVFEVEIVGQTLVICPVEDSLPCELAPGLRTGRETTFEVPGDPQHAVRRALLQVQGFDCAQANRVLNAVHRRPANTADFAGLPSA